MNSYSTYKVTEFFYKLTNNSLPLYFGSYKTLIQPLTDTCRYPLRRPLYQTFRVNHEFVRMNAVLETVMYAMLSTVNTYLLIIPF